MVDRFSHLNTASAQIVFVLSTFSFSKAIKRAKHCFIGQAAKAHQIVIIFHAPEQSHDGRCLMLVAFYCIFYELLQKI